MQRWTSSPRPASTVAREKSQSSPQSTMPSIVPLKVTVLNSVSEPRRSPYETVHSVVSAHPTLPDASITTSVEQRTGDSSSLRVAIYNGPDSPEVQLHVSFDLSALQNGSSTAALPTSLCWASFPHHKKHPLLCLLVNPTMVSIWDAYPDTTVDPSTSTSTSAEYSWNVSLPFECSGIHSLGEGGGLLLQRQADNEDQIQAEDEDGMAEDGFFLKSPSKGTHARGGVSAGARDWTPLPHNSAEQPVVPPAPVASLFSLQHPLDDVLPVSEVIRVPTHQRSSVPNLLQQPRQITDVFEQVLWVGCTEWSEEDEKSMEANRKVLKRQTICVTYHTLQGRHAIWSLQDAPPPPPTPPLYRRTRSAGNNLMPDDWAIRNQQQQGDSFFSIKSDAAAIANSTWSTSAAPPAASLPPAGTANAATTTRDEALADALGVRRTPRMSIDRSLPPQHRVSATTVASAGGVTAGNANTSTADAMTFMSPRSEAGVLHDVSFFTANANSSPFAAIHSNVSMQCLYKESQPSARAKDVFLISNLEGSGTLRLCMVCPKSEGAESRAKGKGSNDPNVIRFFQLRPRKVDWGTTGGDVQRVLPDFSCHITVAPMTNATISCQSAIPVQATPIPACFHSSSNRNADSLATDLLLLRSSNRRRTSEFVLTLYRAEHAIVDCELGTNKEVRLLGEAELWGCVRDRVSLMTHSGIRGSQQSTRQRVQISMRSRSRLTERVLGAIDAALASQEEDILKALALMIRADVCRLEQSQTSESASQGLPDDMYFAALETVLSALVDRDVFGRVLLASKATGLLDKVETESSSWKMLLESDYHEAYSRGSGLHLDLESPDPTSIEVEHSLQLASLGSLSVSFLEGNSSTIVANFIFDSVHILYEDFKLSTGSHVEELPKLASWLSRTARKVDDSEGGVMNAFLEHYGYDVAERDPSESASSLVGGAPAKSILTSFSAPPSFFEWMENQMEGRESQTAFDELGLVGINSACTKLRAVFRIFSALFRPDGPGRDLKVVELLLEEGYDEPSLIRDDFPSGVALPILEVLFRCRNDPSVADLEGWSPEAWHLVGRQDRCWNLSDDKPACGGSLFSRTEGESGQLDRFADRDNDGLVPLEKSSAMIFPKDNRIHEAGRLLRSSRPIFLRVPRAVEVSDHDYERLKQKKLLERSVRTLALPVGRGMLSIGTLDPVEAEPLPLPDLCLQGRVPPTNATLALDESECPSKVWPEFHNGVAAGLRLPLSGDSPVKITRTWIVYNRPSQGNAAQAGGEDLLQRQSHTHGGLLLALGLRGHLTALEMSDVYEYLTQGNVTTTVGVLLGMAANKRGSCDMAVSKMLCLHIPSLIPQHFSAIDVHSTVQAAALIGAGLLFQRSSHRMMTEFLLNEIGRRPHSDASAFDRESYTLSCGLALGMVNLRLGEKRTDGDRSAGIADLKVKERLYRYMVGGIDNDESRRRRETNDRFSLPSASANGDGERCSTIYEGAHINTDVTSAGATLALGLMYMKTGNHTIASALSLPDTHFLLEFVRPDFLALRVISKSLILWNTVEPTNEWIDAQVPSVVRTAYEEMRGIAQKAMEGKTTSAASRHPEYDRRAVRQIRAHLIAGACFGMGLRFAGTGDERAKAVLFNRVQELKTLRDCNDALSVASRPEIPILDSCLACAAMSLAMVLSGSGDLDALRLFKILRWRCDEESRYGTHMMYAMAIGLLFLGGGKCTLGREPEDLAALVTAFFPRYPMTTSDNEYHLQALRHLYALATKRQDLCAVDVDSGEAVHLPVEIVSVACDRSAPLSVPCLLRNSDTAYERLRVVSDLYYPLEVELRASQGSFSFFVKRRNGGQLDGKQAFVENELPNSASTSAHNRYLGAYADYLHCSSDSEFRATMLHECISEDAEEALSIYLSIADAAISTQLHWDLRLCRTYYEERHRFVNDGSKKLLNVDLLLAYLHETTEQNFGATHLSA